MAEGEELKPSGVDSDAARVEREQQLEIAAVEREIMRHAQHLHDDGIIDLDAPARDVVQVIEKHFPGLERPSPGAGEAARPAGDSYWLVGDRGWCNHLHD